MLLRLSVYIVIGVVIGMEYMLLWIADASAIKLSLMGTLQWMCCGLYSFDLKESVA